MLQEIINELEDAKYCKHEFYQNGINYAITLIRSKLPEFEDAIKKAVTYGNRQEFYDGSETLGQDYYNQNYKK